jgi:hypothetical protein
MLLRGDFGRWALRGMQREMSVRQRVLQTSTSRQGALSVHEEAFGRACAAMPARRRTRRNVAGQRRAKGTMRAACKGVNNNKDKCTG